MPKQIKAEPKQAEVVAVENLNVSFVFTDEGDGIGEFGMCYMFINGERVSSFTMIQPREADGSFNPDEYVEAQYRQMKNYDWNYTTAIYQEP